VFTLGKDLATIPYTTDDEVLANLKSSGGAIGFLGVTMLGTKVQGFCKPLKRGVKALEDLDRVSRDVVADVLIHPSQTKLPLGGLSHDTRLAR
jgi:hypothetical protein